jgi:hypothetical protein
MQTLTACGPVPVFVNLVTIRQVGLFYPPPMTDHPANDFALALCGREAGLQGYLRTPLTPGMSDHYTSAFRVLTGLSSDGEIRS